MDEYIAKFAVNDSGNRLQGGVDNRRVLAGTTKVDCSAEVGDQVKASGQSATFFLRVRDAIFVGHPSYRYLPRKFRVGLRCYHAPANPSSLTYYTLETFKITRPFSSG